MIKTILVAVDGSPHSVKAVRLGSDLAAKYGAEIILLHVLLRGHMPAGLRKALEIEIGDKAKAKATNLVAMPQQIMARVKGKKQTQLTLEELDYIAKYVLSSVAEICRQAGVSKVTKRVEEGNAAEIIVAAADEAKADMIIMGRRGLSDLRGLLMGSVSNKVSQLSRHTCVTVR